MIKTDTKNMKETKGSGFTIIELLVVLAVILIIASLVIVSLEESRQKSRNAARATQINEYQKAFNLYWTDTGHYPCAGNCPSGNNIQRSCLGDYAPAGYANNSGTCWNGQEERTAFAATFIPEYMAQMPEAETRTFGTNGYTGILYSVTNGGRSYSIQYYMEGNDRPCILDNAVATDSGPDTLCTLTVTP